MSDTGEKLIVLVLGLVFIVVFLTPEAVVPELSGQVVEIVVISPTDADYPKYEYMAKLAEKNLNEYCNDIGLNATFKFDLYSANRSMAQHYDIVFEKHFEGVDLVVGGGWSSYLFILKSFIDDNHVIIVSPSSTNPQEAMLQDDYIYRLSIHDFNSGNITAYAADSLGVDKMLIIERGDAWAEGLGDWFTTTYDGLGGTTIGRVRYPTETTNFTKTLDEAEQILLDAMAEYPDSNYGIFLLSSSETIDILDELDEYPMLSSVTWFSTEAVANELMIPANLHVASDISLISPQPSVAWNAWSTNIALGYNDATGDELDFYDANIYDSCIVLGLSVVEADSVNASLVREEIIGVSEDYFGLTGPCGLDENGNRLIYQAALYRVDEDLNWSIFKYYYSSNNTIGWNVFDE